MALIQNPAITRKLQRFLRLTTIPDAVLAPETVGVVIVEDLSAPLTDQERGCAGVANVLGVVGEKGLISLVRVGAPAQYDLVVTAITMFTPTLAGQIIRVHAPPGGTGTLNISPQTSFTDFTIPGRPSSQLGFDTQAAVPLGEILYEVSLQAATPYRIPVNIRIGTLRDGVEKNSLTIACAIDDVQLMGGFEWTESGPLG